MSNGQEWIGRILLTSEDVVYGSDGEQILNYNYCDGSDVDTVKFPLLAEKLPEGFPEYTGTIATVTYPPIIRAYNIDAVRERIWYDSDIYKVYSCLPDGSGQQFEFDTGWDCLDGHYATAMKVVGDVIYAIFGSDKAKTISTSGVALTTTVTIGIYAAITYHEGFLWVAGIDTLNRLNLDFSLDEAFTAPHLAAYGLDVGVDGYLYLSGSHAVDTGIHIYKISPVSGELAWRTVSIETQNVVGLACTQEETIQIGGREDNTASIIWGYTSPLRLPAMDAPAGSPHMYKIISDLYWYQIGDNLKSNNDKLTGESGATEFDLLLCDGSTLDNGKYPLLAEALGGGSGGSGEDYKFVGVIESLVSYNPSNICCSDDMMYVYVADSSTKIMYRSVDYGRTFQSLGKLHTYGAFQLSCSSDGSTVYFTQTPTAYIYKSVDYGETFSYVSGLGISSVTAIACSGAGTVVYVTDIDSRRVYRSYTSASSFTNLGTIPSGTPRGICCDSTGSIVYVVSTNSTLYKSTDSGATFTLISSSLGGSQYYCACSSDGVTVYVSGLGGEDLYLSLDGGTSFSGLTGVSGSIGIACSSDGISSYMTVADNGGQLWESVYSDTITLPNKDPQTVPPTKIVADLTED